MKTKKIIKSSHPVMYFIYLSIIFIVLSAILSAINMQATYDTLTTVAGEVESTTVSVNSIFSLDGIKFLISSVYDNLIKFAPFSNLLIATIALGIAINSGFLKSLCSKITKKVPKSLVVFLFSLLCIILSIDGNMGYVILIPIGAILFMSMNRNPALGITLAFASLASGYGAGLFVTSLDYNLSSYTEAGAKLLDTDYAVSQNSNLIFIIVATFLIAGVCTIITEKIMLKRLGRNDIEEEEIVLDEASEKKGIIGALVAGLIILIPIIIMMIPGKGFLGLLLDKSQTLYSKMVFSNDALFMKSLTFIASIILAFQGFVYGIFSGTITKIRDMVNFSTSYLKKVGGIFVLVFFAAQFCAIVEETNIGIVLTGMISNLIGSSNFSFIPLVIITFLGTALLNMFVPGSIAKYSIVAPNVMTTIIKANITPEFAQIVFRAGDSITNSITPIFGYFVIFLGFIEVYTKKENVFSIRKCYKNILPYFLGITLCWLVLIILWYVINLPIGIGVYPSI